MRSRTRLISDQKALQVQARRRQKSRYFSPNKRTLLYGFLKCSEQEGRRCSEHLFRRHASRTVLSEWPLRCFSHGMRNAF